MKKPRIQVKTFKLICVNGTFQDEEITGLKEVSSKGVCVCVCLNLFLYIRIFFTDKVFVRYVQVI